MNYFEINSKYVQTHLFRLFLPPIKTFSIIFYYYFYVSHFSPLFFFSFILFFIFSIVDVPFLFSCGNLLVIICFISIFLSASSFKSAISIPSFAIEIFPVSSDTTIAIASDSFDIPIAALCLVPKLFCYIFITCKWKHTCSCYNFILTYYYCSIMKWCVWNKYVYQ